MVGSALLTFRVQDVNIVTNTVRRIHTVELLVPESPLMCPELTFPELGFPYVVSSACLDQCVESFWICCKGTPNGTYFGPSVSDAGF